MDPITLIVTALVQGAAKAATDLVPDAHKGLREVLQKRFAGKPDAEMVLREHAADPETYQGRLKVSLIPLQRLDPAPAEHLVDVVGHGHQSSPDGAEAIGPQQVEAQGAQ